MIPPNTRSTPNTLPSLTPSTPFPPLTLVLFPKHPSVPGSASSYDPALMSKALSLPARPLSFKTLPPFPGPAPRCSPAHPRAPPRPAPNVPGPAPLWLRPQRQQPHRVPVIVLVSTAAQLRFQLAAQYLLLGRAQEAGPYHGRVP